MKSRRQSNALQDEINLFHRLLIGLVRLERRDLTIRQLAVFLTCYLLPNEDHTVRGLAQRLHTSRPAISRILDRLSKEELIRRRVDRRDRRSILVERTRAGRDFLANVSGLLASTSGGDLTQAAVTRPAASLPNRPAERQPLGSA